MFIANGRLFISMGTLLFTILCFVSMEDRALNGLHLFIRTIRKNVCLHVAMTAT
jgi:hypothetical protein